MVTSYIWLVLFVGLILLFTNRHLITSRRPQLKPNGHTILEVIQHTYEIEEIELKKTVKQYEDDHLQLIIRLLFNRAIPETELLTDTAAHIAAQVKEALLHAEDFQQFKLYFINKQETQKQNSIVLLEYNVAAIGTT